MYHNIKFSLTILTKKISKISSQNDYTKALVPNLRGILKAKLLIYFFQKEALKNKNIKYLKRYTLHTSQ